MNDIVIQYRANHGLTQAKLAELLGVSLRCVQHYEAGTRPVPLTVLRLIDALDYIEWQRGDLYHLMRGAEGQGAWQGVTLEEA